MQRSVVLLNQIDIRLYCVQTKYSSSGHYRTQQRHLPNIQSKFTLVQNNALSINRNIPNEMRSKFCLQELSQTTNVSKRHPKKNNKQQLYTVTLSSVTRDLINKELTLHNNKIN